MPHNFSSEEVERLGTLIELMSKDDKFKDIVKDVIQLRNIVTRLEHRTEELDINVGSVADRVTRLENNTTQDMNTLKKELHELTDRITSKINMHMEAITTSIHKLELHDASQAPLFTLLDKIMKAIAVAIAVGVLGAIVKYST